MTPKQQHPRWLSLMVAVGGCGVLAVSLAQTGPAQMPFRALLKPVTPAAAPVSTPPTGEAPSSRHTPAQIPTQGATLKSPTQLIDLPRLDNRAITELIHSLVTQLEIVNDYAPANAAQAQLIAVPTGVVAVGPTLVRTDAQQHTRLLRLGYLRRPGQLPQLWVRGMVAPDPASINPDSAQMESAVSAILASREKSEADIPFSDLRSQMVNLAYIDADSAISMLKAMGFNTSTAEKPLAGMGQMNGLYSGLGVSSPLGNYGNGNFGGFGGVTMGSSSLPGYNPSGNALHSPTSPNPNGTLSRQQRVSNHDLPIVIRVPTPNPQDVGLVGAAPDGSNGPPGTGQSGVTTILGASSRLSTETLSSPTSQLMVLYNPDRPEQLGQVRRAINESIDTSARQIVIEAMVLEVTSTGLRDLGVQWNYQKGLNTLAIGSLTAGSGRNTMAFTRDTALAEAAKNFFIKVEALVQTGKAEVLARPSVLTLDNRQASIRVGTDIPIATSRDTSSGLDARVSYSFFYLPTGIQLNVRPRIDNEGREISLQIDAAVSTTVANLGAQIKSPGDVVLAAAPAVSTRRVQTYARIPNSTPLIIGGLISRTRDEVKDATPLLGEIPILGRLFSAKKETSSRDEVIIVLTPYVLEQGRMGIEAALPKDAPEFEYSHSNALFRKNVRLRAEDTINLAYIRENARLLRYRHLVQRIASVDPTGVAQSPLALVMGNRTPGEAALMTGMLYGVIANHYKDEPVPAERMRLFQERDKGEVVVRSLAEVLARLGDGRNPESFFSIHPHQCLTITFSASRKGLDAGNVLAEPEPRVGTVDCKADRSDWSRQLYELNRNTSDTIHHTIVLKDTSDLLRLSHAIALRRLIQINGGKAMLGFDHLGIGRVLSLPEFGEGQNHLLEAEVADYFYLSQHALLQFEQEFESAMTAIDQTLRSTKFKPIAPTAD